MIDEQSSASEQDYASDHSAIGLALHLQWAQEHRGWTLNQWGTVLFTDESRFTVDHNDGRVRGDAKVNVTTPSSHTTAGELVRSWSGWNFVDLHDGTSCCPGQRQRPVLSG